MRLIIAIGVILLCGYLSAAREDVGCVPYMKVKSPSILKSLMTPKLKQDPKDIVKFLLFTRDNQNCYQTLQPGSLSETYFNPALPVKFIIHGWRNNASSGVNREIKDAYLSKGNYNVIVVDWGGLAKEVNYNYVSNQVDAVGEIIANFAETLHQEMQVPYDNMYLIGHSLGAQVAGHAGHVAKGEFNTLFALDPAARNFQKSKNQSRIDNQSAKYVEVIHTDIRFAGSGSAAGHADFFPNYGKNQRGCRIGKCSHSRAYKYFAESITSAQGFWGIRCGSIKQIKDSECSASLDEIALMGGDPSIPKSGLYYFPTNKQQPFARGKNFQL